MTLHSIQQTPWYVLGPGAIGCLWTAYWQQQHAAPFLIGRKNSSSHSLTLSNKTSSLLFDKVVITSEQIHKPIQYLLITTKAHQTQQAFKSIEQKLTDDAIIISLQNGISYKYIPLRAKQRLYAASTTDGAYFSNVSTLRHIGPGITHIGFIKAGEAALKLAPTNILEQTHRLRTSLPKSLNIEPCSNIEEILWRKLAINCAINALGVKYRCKNGELVSCPLKRNELKALCLEITSICKALNLGEWFEQLYAEVIKVAELTHNNYNSTLQDINQKKMTEIDELNGFLCREAAKVALPTPINQALVDIVKEHESRY